MFLNQKGKQIANKFKKSVSDYETKINELKRMVNNKKADSYWLQHPDEKMKLETDLINNKIKIQILENKIHNITNNATINELKQKIKNLNKQLDMLGLFNIKEKKEIRIKIDDLVNKMNIIKKEMDDEIAVINNEIKLLKLRISKINRELAKPR